VTRKRSGQARSARDAQAQQYGALGRDAQAQRYGALGPRKRSGTARSARDAQAQRYSRFRVSLPYVINGKDTR
jgi:hypothetical protein